MSTATLSGLRDYLFSTLSPSNMIWLGTQLTEYGHKQSELLNPYSKEELLARIEESEHQLANGQWQDFDEAMEDLEKEFAEEDRKLGVTEAI